MAAVKTNSSNNHIPEGVDLVTSLRQLRDCPYYWGPLGKEEAETKLCNQPVGAFLLRDSSDEKHFFALSFRMADGTHHVRISYVAGSFNFDHMQVETRFSSILHLVYDIMMKSRNKEMQFFVKARGPYEAPIPVNILYPISRDNVVHSLLHLTRSTIRRRVRLDHIDDLALPTHLKDYLKDSQYLYEQSDTPLPVFNTDQVPHPPPIIPSPSSIPTATSTQPPVSSLAAPPPPLPPRRNAR